MEKYKKTYHQVIILGNGFDLACGLPSTYQKFFSWRIQQLQDLLIIPQRIPENNPLLSKIHLGLNLLSSIDDGQATAEEALDILWKYFSNHETFNKSKQASLIDFFPNNINSDWMKSFNFWDLIFLLFDDNKEKNWFNVEEIMDVFLKEIFIDKEFVNQPPAPTNNYNKLCRLLVLIHTAQRQKFLEDQLIIFERNFAVYISKIVRENKGFMRNAKNKFRKILYDHKPKYEEMKATVLSFNYSLCDQDEVQDSNRRLIYRWFNIHGYANYKNNNLEYPPIFGIDSTALKNESDSRNIFTKSYQVAFNNIDSYKLEFPPEAYCISFYGHSLSRADYSYFESIFDMYNLYSSKTYLCFYCGVYDPSDKLTFIKKKEALKKADPKYSITDEDIINSIRADNSEIKQKLMKSIYKLIYHYGSSLSQNHGDNLFHRLLLEGRIKVDLDQGARK